MAQAAPPLIDFRTAAGRAGWTGAHDIAGLQPTSEGLEVTISGNDPYLHGPAAAVPTGKPLWLRFRLKASQTGMGQVFFYTPRTYAAEADSVRFPVRAGRWEEIEVALPPLSEPHYHFRIDPPGEAGATVTLATLSLAPRVELPEPTEKLPMGAFGSGGFDATTSGPLVVERQGDLLHIQVGGMMLATAPRTTQLGYQLRPDSPVHWTTLTDGTATDPDGGHWKRLITLTPGKARGSIALTITVTVDQDRWLSYLPALLVLGSARKQALLAGVEYLDVPDKSSSEDDLRGLQAQRQVPDAHMLTLPLMALQTDGRYLGLAWEKSPQVVACFDSPDRLYGSGGHLMALLLPGGARPNGKRMPHRSVLIKAGQPMVVRATLYGGPGESILPAVQAWVRDHPLPPVPKVPDPFALATTGWLLSETHVGGKFRHALPGSFAPQPAADAALLLDYLAGRPNAPQAERLRAAAKDARAALNAGDFGGVGHIRTLAPALLRSADALAVVRDAAKQARARLSGFTVDGTIPYRAGTTDYGSTHFEKTANGLTAPALVAALESAGLSGDKALIAEAVRRARQVHARWKNTVPRGAQTWEVPLHTPDILASGHLVKAMVLAYELTGAPDLLDAARHWAWTGVPFVYLVNPAPGEPVGLYATTPVLGATGWVAPNWIGLPVQWCGLVYADALQDLAAHDTAGPWTRLADGICASGVLQSFPAGSDAKRQGLLPDSYNLVAQIRNDPAINPATVLVPTARALGQPIYGRAMLSPGVLVHAPGKVIVHGPRRFTVRGWPSAPYAVLITGLRPEPTKIRGSARKVGYNDGVLILEVAKTATLEF